MLVGHAATQHSAGASANTCHGSSQHLLLLLLLLLQLQLLLCMAGQLNPKPHPAKLIT